jgi:hypothetical protein
VYLTIARNGAFWVTQTQQQQIQDLMMRHLEEHLNHHRTFDLNSDPTYVDFMTFKLLSSNYMTPEFIKFVILERSRVMDKYEKDFIAIINFFLSAKQRHPELRLEIDEQLMFIAD